MSSGEDREALARVIARTMPGWNEDTSEPMRPGWSEELRLLAEQTWVRINEECLRQGRIYADAILAAGFHRTPAPAPDVQALIAFIRDAGLASVYGRLDAREVIELNAILQSIEAPAVSAPQDITEVPDEVLVEGSWFKRDELPTLLGNFMRLSDEYARQVKDATLTMTELRSTVVTGDMAQRAGAALFERLGPQIANAREWTEHGRAALEAALGVSDV